MAPLYKRYIPPKPSDTPVSVSEAAPKAAATPKVQPDAGLGNGAEKKRKRERSEEEVAERKAKKLRKKGVEPSVPAVAKSDTKVKVKQPAEIASSTLPEGTKDDEAVEAPKGDFAHITNVKKRHKLEKEARKAKKAAEKEVREEPTGTDDVAVDGIAGHDEERRDGGRNAEDDAHIGGETEVKKPKKRRKKEDTPTIDEHGTRRGAAPSEGEIVNKPEKKEKRKKHQALEELPKSQAESINDAPPPGDQDKVAAEVALSQPKKRRHRLEAVLTRADDNNQETAAKDDDEHLRNHGGVLDKFQKATKFSQAQPLPLPQPDGEETEHPVLRDLVPLPQLEKSPTPEFKPEYSTLPAWIAKPTIISSDSKASFADLGLDEKTVRHLSGLGFKDALPVQQGLIPLLLPPGIPGASFFPGTEPVLPDLAVSAATGSGKTIAYLLPIIEALKRNLGTGRLKALVVVPTRELVVQVAAVTESLAKGSEIRVGTATGTGKLKDEQEKLIKRSQKHDPDGYEALMAKAHRRNYPPSEDSDDFDDYLDELEQEDPREAQRINDTVSGLIDHIPTYTSPIDILVCTPGRLLEHINTTLGFSVSHLEWLVLDEADKLLDQQYDGFLEALNTELLRERSNEEQDARERYLRKKGCWEEQRERRVRKVVLSATMTRDVSKLVGLRLQRPRMIVVRGAESSGAEVAAEVGGVRETGDGFELPPGLVEYCVPIGDGSEKPLFLVNVLEEKMLPAVETERAKPLGLRELNSGGGDLDDDGSSSESSVDSASSSELSSSSAEGSSDSDDDDEDAASKTASSVTGTTPDPPAIHPDRAALFAAKPSRAHGGDPAPTILIFVSSNESATRLSHLLRKLKPSWTPWLTTLTKSASKPKPTHPTPTTASQPPSITISTDRSSRGLDQLQGSRNITHVVQYDVPRSLTSYIHRVGRTARAGRKGEAWTLYTHAEAHWFLHEVARAKGVRRGTAGGVEKVKIGGVEGLRERYEEVLEGMREEVFGGGGEGREK